MVEGPPKQRNVIRNPCLCGVNEARVLVVQTGGLQSLRQSGCLARRPFKGWRSALGRWLIALAFLIQLLVPAGHCHSPDLSVRQSVGASGDLAASSFGTPTVPCPRHGAKADGRNDHGPGPCHNDCCCPCCQLVHAAAVIAPSGTAQAIYAPLLSETVAAPETLASLIRPAAFAGQPRAPPILI
jgi:hypothetical protein